MTKSFKTRSKFGYQPVILNDLALKLFKFYMEHLRSLMSDKYPDLNNEESPLFPVICKQKIASKFLYMF